MSWLQRPKQVSSLSLAEEGANNAGGNGMEDHRSFKANENAAGARIEERTHAPNGLLAFPYKLA